MPMIISSDAKMVREGAHDFFREKSPILSLRKLRDSQDPDGFSRPLWREMAELGWTGFLVPEDHGGSGFGHVLGVFADAGHGVVRDLGADLEAPTRRRRRRLHQALALPVRQPRTFTAGTRDKEPVQPVRHRRLHRPFDGGNINPEVGQQRSRQSRPDEMGRGRQIHSVPETISTPQLREKTTGHIP